MGAPARDSLPVAQCSLAPPRPNAHLSRVAVRLHRPFLAWRLRQKAGSVYGIRRAVLVHALFVNLPKSRPLNKTSDYYEKNAERFFADTINADMSAVYERFLAQVPAGGSLLDAGCGSGRDARHFSQLGYRVSAFDASAALARKASLQCGFDVRVRTFSDINELAAFDAIWCCASLLHIPAVDLPDTFSRLAKALKPGGCLYVSFKLGAGERVEDGRHFTDADESRLRSWVQTAGIALKQTWISDDVRPDRSGQWINAIAVKSIDHRLITGGEDPFLPHLSRAMTGATDIGIAVAFVKVTGLRLLLPELHAKLVPTEAGVEPLLSLRILTSDYLCVTDPEALRLLLLLQEEGADVRMYVTQDDSFHLKAYLFARRIDGVLAHGTAFIGSSNISRQALQHGLEWNYRVAYPHDSGFVEAQQRFEELFAHQHTVPLTDEWIDSYEKRRVLPPRPVEAGSQENEPPPQPTAVQERALAELSATRGNGYRRGLVVLATGLGKTWLAAFDVAQMGARRVLFVAHREEILHQAAETFVRIRPGIRVGLYMGTSRDAEVDIVCASVQTLSRAAHLERFSPQHFDYVVIDEFHHAAAGTYRRLLAHFAPSFLLGLTATPDRTDQSDILSLCDDNLVYTCNLFDGIEAGLLAPFLYFGILDEEVNYEEIPWRNGKFDPESLSNKLATLARARHALKEWRTRSQKRTLAFCVSIKHAEFMAAHFRAAGIDSVAVYAGSATGRAEALDLLEKGQIRVVFSVDLFNEGVDLPGIDTVMMLRPTESKILFLQQLGRGLRRSEGKTHLTVLDFIGNHQSFLQKPSALFGVGNTYKDLAKFAHDAEQGRIKLPDGCYVNYDLRIIEFLKSLDDAGPRKEYEALSATLGRRPTLTEFYRAGASMNGMRRQYGSWFRLVGSQNDLTAVETALLERLEPFLREVETTAMTKSFKMILLEAWLELDGLNHPPTLTGLAERSRQVIHRRPALLSDLSESVKVLQEPNKQWEQYWRDNPVNAWIGGNIKDNSMAHFRVADSRFEFKTALAVEEIEPASTMIQELVHYRLATYEARQVTSTKAAEIVAFPKKGRVELPFFPNIRIACGHFRTGSADAEEYVSLPPSYGSLNPERHFIAKASGNSMDGGKNPIRDGDALLLELVSPTAAGSITGTVMAIERHDANGDNQYLLRIVTKNAQGQYVLRASNRDYEDLAATDEMRTLARLKSVIDPFDLQVGKAFLRENIPPLFGETFNAGNWHAGHVVLDDKKIHVLLVTLNKQGKSTEHRYHDYWKDGHTLHWQSQNSTDPTSKRGREIINHESMGIAVHLFVRESKLVAGKAAPFVYYGKAQYESHTGSKPMSVLLSVD